MAYLIHIHNIFLENVDCAKWNSGTPDSRTSFRVVENGVRICPAPGVEPVTIRMGSGRHRFYATVVSVVMCAVVR
jgi:hypothetical protein